MRFPYLRSFGIRLNDRATDEQRQDLVQFIPRVVGTVGDGMDDRRKWLAADHVAHVSLPRWLDAAGLSEHAVHLRGLPIITNREEWRSAQGLIRQARDAAYELRRARWEPIRKAVREAVDKALAAAAAAAAVAVAADAAAAVAADADDRYWAIRNAVYKATYDRLRATYGERFAPLIAESWSDAVDLYGRLINPAA